ncbi:hypothetical protein JG687_00007492 [Phytophthora cactorum]|uniref:protein-tyrosine-phosphatase n=1 Tax=Phytophthora cactorum TaxID=29920 RepID=A0A8T1UF03_9STRA|nr:hypothetical protein JG687_00007492 [Phytophthora cactorum]
MPKEELPVVSLLLERQSHHPLLEGFPMAAGIGDLPLYLGEAGAAQVNSGFMETNEIQAVIALGTGNLTVKPCEVLLIDILDMEEELLLPHFEECINFLKKHLMREGTPAAVLVHCVYGQSRSATICVAYLMATEGKTLLEAYDAVQKARPCISINPGFLRQLELFERMGNDPEIMGSTPAHAQLRTMMAKRQRMKAGCNYVLCTTRNQLSHSSANGGICAGILIEPMQWMTKDSAFVKNNDGKLLCPSCKAKLGSWNWIGVKCNCKRFVSPAFHMGGAVSSITVGSLAANSFSPNAQAILAAARTINEQNLKQFTLTTQREFRLDANKLKALVPGVPTDKVEQVFALFDPQNSGEVDSCELLATLVLAAPQLSLDTKQKGLMVADEATLLFRTVVVGTAKVLHALATPPSLEKATHELPRVAFFENLTKTMYGERETLTYLDFAQSCQDTPEIEAFMVQWTFSR